MTNPLEPAKISDPTMTSYTATTENPTAPTDATSGPAADLAHITNAAGEVRRVWVGVITDRHDAVIDTGGGEDGSRFDVLATCGDLGLALDGARVMALGDANGPWAVDVTEAVRWCAARPVGEVGR